ncbi:uncharacterized protein G2W53_039865 [Senna tora]|uniref:Uncharacterized protein n=1 Tax=Senna tora TaxID=362788 RepID=A0A834T1Y2_9FABA|nr:uncharacterized protein G2W53_039865 [Senna tora]
MAHHTSRVDAKYDQADCSIIQRF